MADDRLKLLLIEDSEDDARIMLQHLSSAGYDPDWERVSDEPGMREALRERTWDLVLCDHSLPRFDAPRALRLLQQHGLEVPFVVVSGRIGEAVVVSLMKAGASDYVHKDELSELAPAVRRVLEEARIAGERKRARQGLELFAGASAAFARSLEVEVVLRETAQLVVAHLADACIVDAFDGSNAIPSGVSHVDPVAEAVMRTRRFLVPPSLDHHPILATAGVREPRVVTAIGPEILEALALAPSTDDAGVPAPDVACALFVPLGVQDRIIGTIGMARGRSRPRFDEMDLRIATEFAGRIASALDNAALLREAQRARAEAEAANRLKDEFLAITSHELRTPMTSILGYTRLLLAGALPEHEREKALEVIDRNTRVLAHILDDLVDYARVSSGQVRLRLAPVHVPHVAEIAIDAFRPAADAKRITLEAAIPDGTITALGDPERLQQVVANLLGNAIHFTPDGGRVNVGVELRGDDVELRVSDTGAGIDPKFLPFVFERFRQGETGPSRRHGGLGLGLAIVKHLVELHGGQVEAHSPGPGCGATFVVRLPLAGSPADAPLQVTAPTIRGAFTCPPELAGLRILVVDDDEGSRRLLDGILDLCRVEVVVAGSAAEAIDAFVDGPPDLLVSDISMPGETGYDLVRRVRQLPAEHGGQVPAIALSAYSRDEDRAAALDAGFDRFLVKPIDPQEFVGVISQVAGGGLAP